MPLTVAQINNAKPGRLSDGRGLSLLVKPSGTKSWTLRAQYGGIRKDYGLGSYPELSLAKAREKAGHWRTIIRDGLDPRPAKKEIDNNTGLFSNVAGRCFESRREGWRNPKHAAQWITTLERYAFPILGNIHVQEITPALIIEALKPIWLSKSETARRLKQRITAVLDFAYAAGLRDHEAPNRAISLGLPRQAKKAGHHAAMPYTKVAAFLKNLTEQPETVGRLALIFTILTAARTSETRFARWEEIDESERIWKIPGNRMKAGEEHIVPLSVQAFAILKKLEAHIQGSNVDFIFPGERKPYISNGTMSKVLKDSQMGNFTVHGFRSSFRDWSAEISGFPGEVAEAALAHIPANKVEAAYRRTKFLDARKELMQEWADYLVK